MNILAFDTTTSNQTIALAVDNRVIAEKTIKNTGDHSKTLLPNIYRMLEKFNIKFSDLDLITIAIGPGSFTGIRISLSTAKGLCYGNQIPLKPISTLKSLAHNLTPTKTKILAVLAAGRGEIYSALYTPTLEQIIEPHLSSISSALGNLDSKTTIVGPYSEKIKARIQEKAPEDLEFCAPHKNLPTASALINLALKEKTDKKYKFSEISKMQPLYLRRSAAEENQQ